MLLSATYEQTHESDASKVNENAIETHQPHHTWKGFWGLLRIQLNQVKVPNLRTKLLRVFQKKEHYKTWNECLVKDSRSIVPYLIHSEKLRLTDETRTKLCTFLQSLSFTETAWESFLNTLPPGSAPPKKRSVAETANAWVSFLNTLPPGSAPQKNRSLVETTSDTTALERLVDSRINKRFKSETMHQPTSLSQPKLVLDLSKASDSDSNPLPTLTGTREGIEEEQRRQKMEKAKRDKLNALMSEHVTQLKACEEKTEQFEKENTKLKEQLLQFTNGLSPTTVLKARRAMEQQNDAERSVECPVCFLQHGQHESYCTHSTS